MALTASLVFAAGLMSSTAQGVANTDCQCSSSQAHLTQAEAQEQLDLHNKFRRSVHGSSRDLSWNCDLMCQAQAVADTCNFAHSGSYSSPIQAGENLATGSDGILAAWLWFQEYPNYVTQSYASGVGHYTAMVWEATRDLGCGKCSNPGPGQEAIYLCQYANGPPNFGFQGTNYYAENAPLFAGSRESFNAGGITDAEVRSRLGMICGWVQWVSSFQTACDALAAYDSSPALLEVPRARSAKLGGGKKNFRKAPGDEETSSLLQTSIVSKDDADDQDGGEEL